MTKLKNSYCLNSTSSYYLNEDNNKKPLTYQKDLWEKVKALRKKGKVVYVNPIKLLLQGKNDPKV